MKSKKERTVESCLYCRIYDKQSRNSIEPLYGRVGSGKKSIEDGLIISDAQLAQLSRLMQDEDYIIKAHEIAKDGIVSQIYPIQGNENAMGFNMLEDSERKKPPVLPETVENIRLRVRLSWSREEPGYFCLIRFIR